MGIDLKAELQVAMQAVRRAATVTTAVQKDLITAGTLEKKDRSPVTVADFASQAVVCAALANGSSVAPIVGEEGSDELRLIENARLREQVGERVRVATGTGHTDDDVLGLIDMGNATPSETVRTYWTLDPIDGTKGFLRGQHYAIALALIDDGEVVAGVLGCPRYEAPDGGTGALFSAIRGRGAEVSGLSESSGSQPARVSAITSAADARVCESVESGHSDHSQSAQITRALGISASPFRIDSQAKYAAVARGDASIYLRLPTRVDYRECIWDHAAGMIVVHEAGGTVTDTHGAPLDFRHGRRLEQNAGIIATSGAIHDDVVATVRRVLAN